MFKAASLKEVLLAPPKVPSTLDLGLKRDDRSLAACGLRPALVLRSNGTGVMTIKSMSKVKTTGGHN